MAAAASIALQAAEVAALAGEAKKARLYLGRANAWTEKLRAWETEESQRDWPTVHALGLFSRGRVLFRLCEQVGQSAKELLGEARDALEQAECFAIEHSVAVRGDLEIFLADIRWWQGRTLEKQGQITEAAELFRRAHSDAAMAHPRFAAEVASAAKVAEAGMYCLLGRVEESLEILGEVLADRRSGTSAREHATELRAMLLERVKPTIDWLASPEAQSITDSARGGALRDCVSEQLRPLLKWWTAWGGADDPAKEAPDSIFLDMWGRGGFARIAAAVRAKPHAVVVVDARSVEDVRRWACALCPLFETVIVVWKGPLGAGMVLAPAPLDLDEGDFGLHGYSLCLGDVFDRRGQEWTVGVAWANPVPHEVGAFLAGEARPLLAAGRLVVVPAPLVGCTQSAVGWTDTVLREGFLSGVIGVLGGSQSGSQAQQRVLDLSRVSLPYVDGVPMADLASVLDSTDEFLAPLRGLLFGALEGGHLQHERWQGIAALESDIQDACRQLRERLAGIAGQNGWRLCEAEAGISAASRGTEVAGREPVTDLLRSCTSGRQDLAPWIPYWRLQGAGGRLDWTCPLDNRSQPPDSPEVSNDTQTWIWPGTGGWLIPSIRRVFPPESG